VDEQDHQKYHSISEINHLLQEMGFATKHGDAPDPKKIVQAVNLFREILPIKPKTYVSEMQDLGLQLSNATIKARLYALTDTLFSEVAQLAQGKSRSLGLQNAILACSKTGLPDRVSSLFDDFLAASKGPDTQDKIEAVVHAAIIAALKLGDVDKAEECILAGCQVAQAQNALPSARWLVRFLGQYWRTTKDLAATQRLFDRLEERFRDLSNRFKIYSAMVQFCVEAGKEAEAQRYVQMVKSSRTDGAIDVRTYGHLALAKAKKNDWDGVKGDYVAMKELKLHSSPHHTASFVPILKLFARSHKLHEVEQFVHLYVDELGVIPDTYVMNLLVDRYFSAGNLDSIPRWIKHAHAFGCVVDAVTFNTMLKTLRKKHRLTVDKLSGLTAQIKAISGELINDRTSAILRTAAVARPQRFQRVRQNLRMITRAFPRTKASDGSSRAALDVKMNVALATGRPAKVLKSFERAVKANKSVTPATVSTAVTAAMQNQERAIHILNTANAKGIDIKPALSRLVLSNIKVSFRKHDDTEGMIKETLARLHESGIEITLEVVTSLVSLYVERGQFQDALNLYDSLSKTYGVPDSSLDLAILTSLLQAATTVSDVNSIRWIGRVASQNQIFPDKRFRLVLLSAIRKARKNATGGSAHAATAELNLLEEMLEMVNARRSQVKLRQEDAVRRTLEIMETAALASAASE
jgi:tetratricopeptide (TPR) repeat protein